MNVRVNIYDASKSEFAFPDGATTTSRVYQIKVATTDESLISGIQVTLANFPQPQSGDGVCILEASGNSSKRLAAPVFSFSQVEASRFQYQDRTVKVAVRKSICYFVITSK